MKSLLIRENYENWEEEEELDIISNKIDKLLEEYKIECIKYFEFEEFGRYVLIGEDEKLYILRDGVEEEYCGFELNIEDIKIEELKEEELKEIILLCGSIEIECI